MLLLTPQNTLIAFIAVVDQLNENLLALHFAIFLITLYAFLIDNLHSSNLSDSAF